MIEQTIKFETAQDLIEILSTIKQSAQPMTLDSTTKLKHVVKSRDNGEKFAEVFEGEIYTTKNEYVSVYTNYGKRVRSILTKLGKDATNFDEGKLPFGKWLQPNLIIEHIKKGETELTHYLRYYLDSNANYKYSEFIMHYASGEIVSPELEERFWNEFAEKKGFSKKQARAGIELKEDQCEPRGVMFTGVNRIIVDKTLIIRKGKEFFSDTDNFIDWSTLASDEDKANQSKALETA